MNRLSRVALLAGVLCLAGCSAQAPAAPAPVVSSPVGTSVFGGTDLAWIEINIAMDEQLQPLLDLIARRGSDPAVKAAAQQVRVVTEAELGTLRALHGRAALPTENPHKGMPMPGMVTPEQVTEAAALTGARFDDFAVARLREHLEQSRTLARSEDQSGVEPETRALATEVLRTREEALSVLDKI